MLFAVSESINSCHSHVLGGSFASRRRTERFLFREKANSPLSARGLKVQKTFKNDTGPQQFEVSFCTRVLGTGDPRNSMGFTRFGAFVVKCSLPVKVFRRIYE